MHLKRIQTIKEIATDMVINKGKFRLFLSLNHVLFLLFELFIMRRVTLNLIIILLAIVTLIILSFFLSFFYICRDDLICILFFLPFLSNLLLYLILHLHRRSYLA